MPTRIKRWFESDTSSTTTGEGLWQMKSRWGRWRAAQAFGQLGLIKRLLGENPVESDLLKATRTTNWDAPEDGITMLRFPNSEQETLEETTLSLSLEGTSIGAIPPYEDDTVEFESQEATDNLEALPDTPEIDNPERVSEIRVILRCLNSPGARLSREMARMPIAA